MYKAVFIDVDGTLIKSDHTISTVTFETIQKLKEKNILVVLVSARPLHGMLSTVTELKLLDFPVASLNGAYIVHKDEILFNSFIEPGIVSSLHDHFSAGPITPVYYEQNRWYAEIQDNYTDKEQKITAIPLIIQPFQAMVNQWKMENNGPNKILLIADKIVIGELQIKLKNEFDNLLHIATSRPTYLEVMSKASSKVNAVKFIIAKYNFLQQEIICIGDNFNDEEMIKFAGMGVAMGNSPGEVKAAADFITDTNNNDGVAKAIINIMDL